MSETATRLEQINDTEQGDRPHYDRLVAEVLVRIEEVLGAGSGLLRVAEHTVRNSLHQGQPHAIALRSHAGPSSLDMTINPAPSSQEFKQGVNSAVIKPTTGIIIENRELKNLTVQRIVRGVSLEVRTAGDDYGALVFTSTETRYHDINASGEATVTYCIYDSRYGADPHPLLLSTANGRLVRNFTTNSNVEDFAEQTRRIHAAVEIMGIFDVDTSVVLPATA